jgi:hypothetical protein
MLLMLLLPKMRLFGPRDEPLVPCNFASPFNLHHRHTEDGTWPFAARKRCPRFLLPRGYPPIRSTPLPAASVRSQSSVYLCRLMFGRRRPTRRPRRRRTETADRLAGLISARSVHMFAATGHRVGREDDRPTDRPTDRRRASSPRHRSCLFPGRCHEKRADCQARSPSLALGLSDVDARPRAVPWRLVPAVIFIHLLQLERSLWFIGLPIFPLRHARRPDFLGFFFSYSFRVVQLEFEVACSARINLQCSRCTCCQRPCIGAVFSLASI